MFVDHLPATGGIGIGGHALEHHGGRAVAQRAVQHVGVTGDPADIGGAPEHVRFAIIEHIGKRACCIDQIAARGVQHALGLAGRAGGIEDEKRIFGAHWLGWAVRAGRVDQRLVIGVAALLPGDVAAGMPHHDHPAHGWAFGQRLIDLGFQGHRLAAAPRGIGRDDDPAVGILDPVAQGAGGKTAEDHRMDGADTRAGEHGDGRFRDHGQIQANPVALGHALGAQGIGEPADGRVQFPVAETPGLTRFIGLPEDGGLVASTVEMAVQAVCRDVEQAVREPVRMHRMSIPVPVEHALERSHPVHAGARPLGPERLGLGHRMRVERFVARSIHACRVGDVFENRIHLRAHDAFSLSEATCAPVWRAPDDRLKHRAAQMP